MKRDVFESDFAGNCFHFPRVFLILHFDRRMEQFQNPLAARHRRLKRIETSAQVTDGIEQPIDV